MRQEIHKDTKKGLFLLCGQQIPVMHRTRRLSETRPRLNSNTCYESKVPRLEKLGKLLRRSVIPGDVTLLIYIWAPP